MMKLTFGFEWEIPILNTRFLPLDREELLDLAYSLREAVKGSFTGTDFVRYFSTPMLELRSRILKDLKETEDTVEKFFEELNNIRKRRDVIIFSSGTYPFSGDTVGFHIHIGSFYSIRESFGYDKYLIPYAPLLGAVMANSPVYNRYTHSDFKSYRVLFQAWAASSPNRYEKDNLRFFSWGTDICNKIEMKPTIEIRIGDAPLSRDIITDYIFLCIGLFLLRDEELNEERFKEYIINRLRIAKQGLQARIIWRGKEREIGEVLLEKMDKIDKRFSKRLCYRFRLLPEMVAKRQTQADFSLRLFEDTKRDILNYILKVEKAFLRNEFTEYIQNCKKMDTLEPPSMEELILDFIVRNSPLWSISELIKLPLSDIEDIVKKLEKKRKIKTDRDIIYGLLLSRL